MKKLIVLIAMLLTAVLAAGCTFYLPSGPARVFNGSGNVTSETREVSGFHAVSLDGAGELTITQGDKESLVIEAEDNLLPLIKTKVQNGVLVITYDPVTTIRPPRSLKFNLGVKELNAIDISGAAVVRSNNLQSDRLTVTVSGAGMVKLDKVEATEVATTMNGASNVELAGTVGRQVATLNGLGNYQTHDLNSKNAQVTMSGAGGATLRADETLDVNISGAGSVTYYGNPRVRQNIAGLGVVRRAAAE